MKILYYDCFCGISGDMNLGALIDLGVDKDFLLSELSKLNLDAEYELSIKKELKKGISGTKVDVILKNQAESRGHDHVHAQAGHVHGHEHSHNHNHHHHAHHGPPPSHHHADQHNKSSQHRHRNLTDIENIINTSSLSEKVKTASLKMFMKVAEAEAKVHGKALREVHFHEVGATDSIIDFVGAAICLDYLQVDKIMSSPVQVGGGFVECAHGMIPIPAPATVEILRDIPLKSGLVPFETTTPTGAAILAANVVAFTDKMDFCIKQIGYGIGNRDLEIPNVLRIYIGEEEKGAEGGEEREDQYIMETNIDDMNPEIYGYIEEKLFQKGALDVYKTAISMKKNRPAVKLSVLITEKQERDILDVVFKETTALGMRKYKVEKIMLRRNFTRVKTQYGDVTVKNAYYKGKLVKYKPEYDDCKKIAGEKNIPIAKVYREVYKMLEENEHD